MTSQIIELSVSKNETVSSLKSVVDSARNRRRTMNALVMLFTVRTVQLEFRKCLTEINLDRSHDDPLGFEQSNKEMPFILKHHTFEFRLETVGRK